MIYNTKIAIVALVEAPSEEAAILALRKTASGLGLTPYEESGEGGDDAFESDDQAIAPDVVAAPSASPGLAVRPC